MPRVYSVRCVVRGACYFFSLFVFVSVSPSLFCDKRKHDERRWSHVVVLCVVFPSPFP